jgi:hypothetical protein
VNTREADLLNVLTCFLWLFGTDYYLTRFVNCLESPLSFFKEDVALPFNKKGGSPVLPSSQTEDSALVHRSDCQDDKLVIDSLPQNRRTCSMLPSPTASPDTEALFSPETATKEVELRQIEDRAADDCGTEGQTASVAQPSLPPLVNTSLVTTIRGQHYGIPDVRKNKNVIFPWDSRYKLWWWITVSASMLTAAVEPFVMAFGDPVTYSFAPQSPAGVQVIEYLLLLVFLADVVVTFRLAYVL